jgi:hypothetical protein
MLNRNVDLAKILHVEFELVILSEAKNLGYGRVLQETIARNVSSLRIKLRLGRRFAQTDNLASLSSSASAFR